MKYLIPVAIIVVFVSTYVAWPKNARDHHNDGMAALDNDEAFEAQHHFELSLGKNKYYRESYIGKGKAYYDMENYKEALVNFKEAERFKNNDLDTLLWITKTYIQLGDLKNASEYIQKAELIDPLKDDLYFVKGWLQKENKDYQKAIASFAKASSISPENLDYYLQAGHCYLKLNLPEKAFAEFQKANELDSTYYEGHFAMGEYYITSGDYDSALEYLDKALAINMKFIEGIELVKDIQFKIGDYSGLQQTLNHLISLEPRNPIHYYHLALTYKGMNDYETSVDNFRKAINYDLGNEIYRTQLEETIQEANRLSGNNVYPYSHAIRKQLGDFHIKQGDAFMDNHNVDLAIFEYRRAIRINPTDEKVRYKLAQIHKSRNLMYRHFRDLELIVNDLGRTEERYVNDLKYYERSFTELLTNAENVSESEFADVEGPYPLVAVGNLVSESPAHYGADAVLREYLNTTFILQPTTNLVLLDNYFDSLSDFKAAQKENVDFLLRGTIKDEEDGIAVKLNLINMHNGKVAKSYEFKNRGNDRFLHTAYQISTSVSMLLPNVGEIFRKKGNDVLINLGIKHQLKEKDKLYIFKDRESLNKIFTDATNSVFAKDSKDIIGELTITELDEKIAMGYVNNVIFVDDIKVGNIVMPESALKKSGIFQ